MEDRRVAGGSINQFPRLRIAVLFENFYFSCVYISPFSNQFITGPDGSPPRRGVPRLAHGHERARRPARHVSADDVKAFAAARDRRAHRRRRGGTVDAGLAAAAETAFGASLPPPRPRPSTPPWCPRSSRAATSACASTPCRGVRGHRLRRRRPRLAPRGAPHGHGGLPGRSTSATRPSRESLLITLDACLFA